MGQPPVALTKAGLPGPDLLRVIQEGAGTEGAGTEGAGTGAARLAFWQAATGGLSAGAADLELRLAADIMALFGRLEALAVLRRRGVMLDRAASALRALGRTGGLASAGSVQVQAVSVPFAGFFAVEQLDLTFTRFDGRTSPSLRREVFVGCDAVTVLPYDPARDRILLIEQMRAGPLSRGDRHLWQIEAVAGRVDAGETPEIAARREAQEEAGLSLERLVPVAEYYPSPGAVSEYLYSYVGLCDLPDGIGGLHGLAAEAEDIRSFLLPLDEAIAHLDRNAFGNAPLILTLHWLARHRAHLQAEKS